MAEITIVKTFTSIGLKINDDEERTPLVPKVTDERHEVNELNKRFIAVPAINLWALNFSTKNENANIIISAEIVVSKNPVIGEPVRKIWV